jgi:mono/diheme cytochrome c family protein
MSKPNVLFRTLTVAVIAVLGTVAAREDEPRRSSAEFSAEQVSFFDKEVRPILTQRCLKCHGGEAKIKGGLRLTARESLLKGGDTGPAVSLDKPADSLLLKAINYTDGLEMPPSGKLSPAEIATLTKWVKAGLPWSAGGMANAEVQAAHAKGGVVTPEARRYWAYQPIKRPSQSRGREGAGPRPAPSRSRLCNNPIDEFILSRREAAGLQPAAPADAVALCRRAYYDLIGLPPTPEQVDAFLQAVDAKPQAAFAELIDSLLESPHYGEKWGRHWLDLVRYAETNGYERDGPKPFAWRYRDYVIRSFNADKPFDRFIKEQLAGDEIDRNDPDCVIATGYYRLGLWDDEPADPEQARYDELDDYVATTAQVFLGMTMNCARCHDHKIDPIPQTDYYRLLAFFADVPHYSKTRNVESNANLTDITPPEKRAVYEAAVRDRQKRLDELTESMTKIEDEAIKKMPAEDQRASEGPDRPQVVKRVPMFLESDRLAEYRRLRRQIDDLKRRPTPNQELALSVNNCAVHPPTAHIMIRGNPHSPGAEVSPGFPEVLGTADPKIPPPAPGDRTSGRRIVLADWIAGPNNPLTARVLANRLWQHHFGRGIVPSANDFGQFGEKPTHPELLDWLANELVDGGWRLKRIHKLIMLSAAYQMSSASDPKALAVDPSNTLFWRFPMRRLTAEEVRDSILAVSGQLNPKAGGPSVYPPIPREVLQGQSMPGNGWGKSPPEEASRRSVYVHVKRSLLVPILAVHDQADTDSSCPVRYTTTVPTQALGMLNGEFTNEQAGAFAERLRREAPGDLAAQVKRAIRLTSARIPKDEEVAHDAVFVRELAERQKRSEHDALRLYCLLTLNANEFVYLD